MHYYHVMCLKLHVNSLPHQSTIFDVYMYRVDVVEGVVVSFLIVSTQQSIWLLFQLAKIMEIFVKQTRNKMEKNVSSFT